MQYIVIIINCELVEDPINETTFQFQNEYSTFLFFLILIATVQITDKGAPTLTDRPH